MHLTQLRDSNTLLTYAMMTTPSPVQVSPSAANPSLAMLTFVVSSPRSSGVVKVAQIIMAIPVDVANKPPDPTNLAATPPPLSSASISSTGSDEWDVKAGVAPGVFIFSPKGGGIVEVSLQSLTITFTGIHVNTLVGTALVKINEWASSAGSTPPPVNSPPSGSVSVEVPKFPYGFFAGNFGTDKPMIENGEHPTLTWVGSQNATYKMLWSTSHTEDVSNIRTWSKDSNPPSPALTDTTTFILQVSAQAGGQTVTDYFNLTVIVANPSFTAHDLTVLTTSTLDGAVAVGKAGAPADLTLSGDLNANGTVKIGTTDTQGAKFAIVSQTKSTGNNTGLFYAPQIGPNTSNIHYGSTGDWYIRSASSQGNVIIQDTGANVTVGGPLSVWRNAAIGGTLTMSGSTPQLILGGDPSSAWVLDQKGGALRIYRQAGGNNTPQFVLEQNVLSVVTEIHNYVPGRNKWYRLLAGSQSGDWQWASWVALPSDIRLKEDVRPIPGALEKVKLLRGIFHRWSTAGLDYLTQPNVDAVSTGPDSTEEELQALQRTEREKAVAKLSGNQLGLVAQDVEAIVPEVVYENEDGHKCIRYQQLVALLIEAIKEQEQTVKERLDQQQGVLEQLKQLLLAPDPEGAR